MESDEKLVLNGETPFEKVETGSWNDPGIHWALATATDDIVNALCALSAKIKEELIERQDPDGESQLSILEYDLSEDSVLASTRMNLFHLFAAISCEEKINFFCYFELPRVISETIEKLQPSEKLLIAAAFLGQPDMKASHIYEELKNLVGWRNHYAHGHIPGRSTESLRKNHVFLPKDDEDFTLEDELRDLESAAVNYLNVITWLRNSGTKQMTTYDLGLVQQDALRFVKLIRCFSVTSELSRPNSEGLRFRFFDIHVDQKKLAGLQK